MGSVASAIAYTPVAAFPNGVMSGDPAVDGVVLWTHVDPGVAGAGVAVAWEVADSPSFGVGSVVASGTSITSPSSDHTVHVEPSGLQPATTYWYRFAVGTTESPVGRTRTLPSGGVGSLRIAYFSCQRYVHGYYTAHADLAARASDPATDVDLVICLGDYVYEAGPADGVTVAGRVDPDAPQLSLDDFRRQYHLYRTDLDLQAMQAAFPVVGIFDNHDGLSGPTDPAGPGAVAAFFEQMPVRRDAGDPQRQHRSFRLGDLAELFMLDERQYRDPVPDEDDSLIGTSSVDQPEMVAPGRTMLGADQLDWLQVGVAASTSAWKILGSQLVFSPLRSERYVDVQAVAGDGPQRNAGRYVNLIGWDGFQAERQAIVDHIHNTGIEDVFVIAGDSHFWTTSELPLDYDDPEAPLVLVEFGGSSVTSANAGEEAGLPGNEAVRPVVAKANPLSLRYIDVVTHGYGLIELTPQRATVTYVSPKSITEPGAPSRTLARFEVDRGTAQIRQVAGDGFLPRQEPEAQTPPTTDTTTPSGQATGTETTSTVGAATGAAPVNGTATFTG